MPARLQSAVDACGGVNGEALAASVRSLAGGLDDNARIAIAVSGGADSLALLLLAEAAFGSRTHVLTVDHGLRAEAASEAAFVAVVAARHGLPHATLAVEVAAGSVQKAARQARYAAMAGWCEVRGIELLLTAHHADDQAETLLMRLARGSGLAGMAGIRACRRIEGTGVRVLRPLLGVRRAELESLVRSAGLRPVHDPSNCDPAYDRTQARAWLRAAPGFDPMRAAVTARHLAEAEAALSWVVDEAWAGRAEIAAAAVRLDASGLPPEIVRRLVLRALHCFDNGTDIAGPALATLITGLAAGRSGNLAGAIAEPVRRRPGVWRFSAEPERRAAAAKETGD